MSRDFVYMDEVICGIRWEAKYFTSNNFTGVPVKGYGANRIMGTKALAEALDKVQHKARALGYGLFLWDGYRPQRAVECFLNWARLPDDGIHKKRYYPNIDRAEMIQKGYVATQSSHSRGSAIDLTLYILKTGKLLPMGGHFDLMDKKSHHDAKNIKPIESENRHLLRSIMENCGFEAYENEWWHYMLKDEPYPDTYFDFPI
ncbi:D-Ala-D-Ala dipeptidase VanX [Aminipila terrae]|uniref:D-alanyl-D-alanine dipeptidase n=1 Tax=Aminipila terrae TaxID=2697030 RepID=A0A6P1MMF1_9FIRM|nr:D-Ala-D-Ala dipeptidase VanX [Aminipila terrae]QHI73268.1 D-Ala-D-Ala dipeptidase VanX [Aminipila terrae]